MVGCALCLFLGIISVLYFVMTVVIFFYLYLRQICYERETRLPACVEEQFE